jgi:hypothetical protein
MFWLLAAAAALPSAVVAQSGGGFNLSWKTLDPAGGTCAGGSFALGGTIGQPDASGTCVGGSFALTGGFWAGMAIEVGPALHIASSGGSAVISWPASATGFYLQHCADLSGRTWLNNTTAVFVFGTDKVVVEPANGIRFYRLRKD